MRKLILLLALVVLPIAGCGDSTGPDDSFVGTYTLETVNGERLPFTLFQAGTNRIEVVSGSLAIHGDGTFSERIAIRTTEGGQSFTEQDGTTGTYTRSDNDFTFRDAQGDTYTGSLQGNTLSVSVEGVLAVYRK